MRKNIITTQLSCIPYEKLVNKLVSFSIARQSSYTCVANVHMCIEAWRDEKFSKIVNDADLVTADGMPLVKSLKILYNIKQERIAGMDLLPDLIKVSEANQIKVFFYGGTEDMLSKTRDFCSIHYPRLSIVGMVSPPFRTLTDDEEQAYVDLINKSDAGFVFVALGCPKQEKWMAKMKGRITASMVGIGGALPVMIGLHKRAPVWMQKASLEWMYRLMQEPRRLFRRYALTNCVFLGLIFKEWVVGKRD